MSTLVVWLSRHEMTQAQRNDLRPAHNGAQELRAVNATFPAGSGEAVAMIMDIVTGAMDSAEHVVGEVVIAGVFPAHVAVELYASLGLLAESFGTDVTLALPVSVPAPAKEGEVRGGGFAHSHWEYSSALGG